jgi:hypothetical protein
MAAGCPPFEATGFGQLDGGGEEDAVAIDACDDTTSVTVLLDARVTAGPVLEGTQVSRQVSGAQAGLAVVDRDGDRVDEVWLFDPTGAGSCWAVEGGQLVSCD